MLKPNHLCFLHGVQPERPQPGPELGLNQVNQHIEKWNKGFIMNKQENQNVTLLHDYWLYEGQKVTSRNFKDSQIALPPVSSFKQSDDERPQNGEWWKHVIALNSPSALFWQWKQHKHS